MKYHTLPKNIVLDECIAIEFLICVDTVCSEAVTVGSDLQTVPISSEPDMSDFEGAFM
jgi:hypothetical protein